MGGRALIELDGAVCVCVCVRARACMHTRGCVHAVRELGSQALRPEVGEGGKAVGQGQAAPPLSSPEEQ